MGTFDTVQRIMKIRRGFDPDQPRDWRGRWIRIGQEVNFQRLVPREDSIGFKDQQAQGHVVGFGENAEGIPVVEVQDAFGRKVEIVDAHRISVVPAAPASAARERHKLPKPKGRDARAGEAAARRVADKRRKWAIRRIESMLATMPEDNPQKAYWEGYLAEAQKIDAGPKPGKLKLEDVNLDPGRLTFQRGRRAGVRQREAAGAGAKLNDAIGFARDAQQEALKIPRPDERERNVNYYAGYLEALQEDVAPKTKELEAEYAKGYDYVLRRHEVWNAQRRGDRLAQALQALEAYNAQIARGDLMAPADLKRQARKRGEVEAQGVPVDVSPDGLAIPRIIGEDNPDRAMGFNVGQNAKGENPAVKVDLANALRELKDAHASDNDKAVAFWAGLIQGFLAEPPKPKVPDAGNLPDAGYMRAVQHRLPGDERYADAAIIDVKDLGGGINTTWVGKLDGGGKVIIKPRDAAYEGQLRDGIEPQTDLERERASWYIGDRMGVDPPRVVARQASFKDPSGNKKENIAVSVQEFRDSEGIVGNVLALDHYRGFLKGGPGSRGYESVRRVALFDSVIGNTDRHHGNGLARRVGGRQAGRRVVDPEYELIPIDHGLTFPTGHSLLGNAKVQDLFAKLPMAGEHRIPEGEMNLRPDEVDILRGLQEPEVEAELLRAGLPPEAVETFKIRVQVLLDKQKFLSSGTMSARVQDKKRRGRAFA